MMRQMFPDTCYGFNSGGDPEKITDLTYEKFKDQYRKHYHPSNAYFFLDGNVPMDEMLPLIASYLEGCERREELPSYCLQDPVGDIVHSGTAAVGHSGCKILFQAQAGQADRRAAQRG